MKIWRAERLHLYIYIHDEKHKKFFFVFYCDKEKCIFTILKFGGVDKGKKVYFYFFFLLFCCWKLKFLYWIKLVFLEYIMEMWTKHDRLNFFFLCVSYLMYYTCMTDMYFVEVNVFPFKKKMCVFWNLTIYFMTKNPFFLQLVFQLLC